MEARSPYRYESPRFPRRHDLVQGVEFMINSCACSSKEAVAETCKPKNKLNNSEGIKSKQIHITQQLLSMMNRTVLEKSRNSGLFLYTNRRGMCVQASLNLPWDRFVIDILLFLLRLA